MNEVIIFLLVVGAGSFATGVVIMSVFEKKKSDEQKEEE